MKTLVIDTSSKNLYVMVLDGQKTTKTVMTDNQRQHSVVLNKAISDTLKKADCALKDIDVYAVCVGTGSFTGIRVGISVAKAYNLVFGKKYVAVNSLCSLAYTKKGRVNCLMDAGKGWYFAVYAGANEIEPPHLIEEEEAQKLASLPDTVIFDDTADYSEQIEKQVRDKIAANNFCDKLTPLYIRVCQAEEERQKGVIK